MGIFILKGILFLYLPMCNLIQMSILPFMRLVIIFVFCSSALMAQPGTKPDDSSIVKIIYSLPASEPFDTVYKNRRVNYPYIYINSQNEMYSLFGNNIAVQYRNFNFGDYHILGTQSCRQCFLFCDHDTGREPCHRNRCSLSWIWQMRENSKAFTEVQVKAVIQPWEKQQADRFLFLKDTVIIPASDSGMASWYTTGRGDCHARFEHRLFKDRYHPVLLLKQWNHWGGCRAGGSKEFVINFINKVNTRYYFKSIILVD
jgi:hypothetical protein